jgi:hypothetical protein
MPVFARRFVLFSLLASLLLTAGCDLELTNPNAATEEEALTDAEGLKALTVGVQRTYATETLPSAILVPGVTSREVAINTTFQNLIELETGGPDLPSNNASVNGLWSNAYEVVGASEQILASLEGVQLPAAERNAVRATALTFKALALGIVAQNFEQGPVETRRSEDAPFRPRQEVFAEALRLLEEAEAALNRDGGAAVGADAGIVAPGLDLAATVSAYQARYALFAGRYEDAITAANATPTDVRSTLPYDDQANNPIWNDLVLAEEYAPRDNFGRPGATDSTDERLTFYLVPADSQSTPNELPVDGIDAFFDGRTDDIPLFLPGEMALIRAEAKLRAGAPASEVVDEIDAVRTKTPSEDVFGVGADLPPYSGATTDAALETEILRQRRAELFMQGLGLEDRRRLGPDLSPTDAENAGPFTRTRNFYPYPQQERINNPNTPENPEI